MAIDGSKSSFNATNNYALDTFKEMFELSQSDISNVKNYKTRKANGESTESILNDLTSLAPKIVTSEDWNLLLHAMFNLEKAYVDKGLDRVEALEEVIDNLTSTSTTNPLSANQGKILNEKDIGLKYTDSTNGEIFNNYTANKASGDYSHAEGNSTTASGQHSHAEGFRTKASSFGSHAEGSGTTASGSYSHAEGSGTTASGSYSHAEGYNTTAYGTGSHSEGFSASVASDKIEALSEDTTVESIINTWDSLSSDEKFSLAKDGAHCEGRNCVALGDYSHVEGFENIASNSYSHAEGFRTKASSFGSHAEGSGTTASASYSHAEGAVTTASGSYSHAEGYFAKASGSYSHAEGNSTTASGECSHAGGYGTTANDYQFVTGKYNIEKTGASGADDQSADSTIFMVGNGTSATMSNAFRITADGKCRGISAFVSSGADYAEYFEWLDENPNDEDRRGKFVTLVGDKIRIANANDDYILGVVSGTGAFIGNSASEDWQGKYLKDVFGKPLTQQVEVPEKTDEKTGEVIPAHTVTQFVLNPDYDPSKEYISREFRKEWSPIGLLGKLVVNDNGKCQVNGYCCVDDDGVAIPSENGYRVMKRIDDNHISILFK